MSVLDSSLIAQYAELHRGARYGDSACAYKRTLDLALLELRPRVVLDYGCGQSDLSAHIQVGAAFHRYDPAIPALAKLPVTRADLVINTDVMEHIPKADADDVLADIRRISARAVFVIATRPALTILPNGENAHCTIMPAKWWLRKIARRFDGANIVYESPGRICAIITWPSAAPDLYRSVCAAEHAAACAAEARRLGKKKRPLSRVWRQIRRTVFRRKER
jgi:hypothetical protein